MTAGQNIKIDYATGIEEIVNANNAITLQIRLYRSGVLLTTRTLSRSLTASGVQRFDVADTFVDTPPVSGTATYELRVLVITAVNVVSGSANNNFLNLIKF
ncbi:MULTISPECIES: hypothetical protein [Bacillaceae]|uniref:hypothetical protein n=1 Tax=Bacillaceae TaxID=186817 RepID=UPI001CA4263F|nr:hypothetical protein [Bacillus infantis]MDW2878475.1 hypothetical protein [Bacillus infantis]